MKVKLVSFLLKYLIMFVCLNLLCISILSFNFFWILIYCFVFVLIKFWYCLLDYLFFCYFWCVFCILVDCGKFLIVVVGKSGRLRDLFCRVKCFLKGIGCLKFLLFNCLSFFFCLEFVLVVNCLSVWILVFVCWICLLIVVFFDIKFFFKVVSLVSFFFV